MNILQTYSRRLIVRCCRGNIQTFHNAWADAGYSYTGNNKNNDISNNNNNRKSY